MKYEKVKVNPISKAFKGKNLEKRIQYFIERTNFVVVHFSEIYNRKVFLDKFLESNIGFKRSRDRLRFLPRAIELLKNVRNGDNCYKILGKNIYEIYGISYNNKEFRIHLREDFNQ